MTGRTIAHYQVLEKLGEGGMGAVYKARDTHLERFAALKILPADKVADPDRRQRFVQEARSASALNHPNIVTIYDIDESEGVHFIAMEYVAGRTLDRLIGRKGLGLKETLSLAVQIADALGRAHAAGIVHRDLKPSNIMVTGDGTVKILDFGLAKLVERAGRGEASPTMTAGHVPITEEGKIVGTVAYMSPEQAEGKPVDARSDIFSFGSVLYEMLTGRRPFAGESTASTLAAILTKEPAPPGELPPEVERSVIRCLRKDPQRRWQTMSDLKVVLQDLKEESESGKLSAVTSQAPRRAGRKLLLAAFAVVLAAAAGVAWWFLRGTAAPRAFEMERITFESGLTSWPAISPDGKLLAYSSDRNGASDLYVQQISGRQAIRLTQHEAADWLPSFSPDGSRIAFTSLRDGGGIYMVEALGGAERKIVDGGWFPQFSPDGATIAYIVTSGLARSGKLYLVPSNGSPARPFQPDFTVPPVGPIHSPPIWSPDGKHLLFDGVRAGDPKSRDWWIAPAAGGDARRVGAPPLGQRAVIRYIQAWHRKHVYYAEGTTVGGMSILRVPIAADSWRIAGPPETIAPPTAMHLGVSISADGHMVFGSMTPMPNIWSVPLKANQAVVSGERNQLTSDSTAKLEIAVAANGSRLAYTAGTHVSEGAEIRMRDLQSGKEEVIVPSGNRLVLVPRLSADGLRLAYLDNVGGKLAAQVTQPGTTSTRAVCEGCRVLEFSARPEEALVATDAQVLRQNLSSGARTVLLDAPVVDAAVAPGGRWLAFTAARPDGAAALYVAPVGPQPAPRSAWTMVSEDRRFLSNPHWSPDGHLLYYGSSRDGFGCVWAQPIADGKPAGAAVAVLHLHRAMEGTFYGALQFTIAPDRLYVLLTAVKGDIYSIKLE